MRQYQPIWERLKRDKMVALIVEPWLVARVKKAVMKEKYGDTVFKRLNSNDRLVLEFVYDKAVRVLTATLTQTIGLDDIRTEVAEGDI